MRVTDQDLEDILCTALFGGIDYWAKRVYFEPEDGKLTAGARVIIQEDEGSSFELKKEDMREAVKNYCGKDYWEVDGSLNTGMLDAADADAIVQLTIFKEQVYG